MSSKTHVPPSPRELVRAYRTLKRVAYATSDLGIVDVEGSPAWSGLVEGRRMLAVTTSSLGSTDDRYTDAWERMLNEPWERTTK